MTDTPKYFVVKPKALPEVLLKVAEANRLLESGKVESVQDATEAVGISRSSFYKYKEDIFPFHESTTGTNFTLAVQLDDKPGLLSDLLKTISGYGANILTIHQSIPINGIATLTLSITMLQNAEKLSVAIEEMEAQNGVHYVKLIGA